MPKPTFGQIPAAKREKVVNEAARLFAQRGFEGTDMAQLAKRAGVSKGSLYNYFESKEDLYLHVATEGLARSRQAVYGGIDPAWDIFRQVEHIFKAGAAFARRQPEFVKLYLNVSAAGMERFTAQLSRQVEKHTADHLKALVARGQREGHVRPDLDPRLGALFINSLYIMMLASLASRHFQIRLQEYLELDSEPSPEQMGDTLDQTIGVINQFLRPA